MSEQAQPVPSRAERIDAAWEDAADLPTFSNQAPAEPEEQEAAPEPTPEAKTEAPSEEITKESLNDKPEPVAPSIKEFLRAHKPKEEEPSEVLQLREQVSELTAALNQIRNGGKPEEKVDPQELLLQKFEELQKQQLEAQQRAEQERIENQLKEQRSTLRAGVITNLEKRKDDYPAVFALGQQEAVVNELFARLQAEDAEASDYSVASEYEESLWKLYDKLHSIKAGSSNTSEERKAASESHTLNNTLTGTDTEEDTSGLTRQERIHRAWLKANS